MIKDANKLDNIIKLSYMELFNLKRSLEEKIKRRKTSEKTLEKKYEEVQIKYANPKNALEELEVASAHHDLANIRAELIILTEALSKVSSRLESLKQKYAPPQPGQE